MRQVLASWRPGQAMVAIPVALIMLISVVDILTPNYVHLGPLLVVAPALTASFGGPVMTGAIGVLAVVAQVVIAFLHGGIGTMNHQVQIITLLVVSAFVVAFCYLRERHERQLSEVRSVSEVAQRVILRPLPPRIGPLRIASMYLAAAAEARIGGDLYAAARTVGGTRLIIGDVRGKGLASVSDAAVLLCAFREASHRHSSLPGLAKHLEDSVCRNLAELSEADSDVAECFVTAAIIEIPDTEPVVHVVDCGHPPPLLVRGDRILTLGPELPGTPLGLGELAAADHLPATFAFEAGDILLLYTDGIVEGRDRTGTFYALTERLRRWAGEDPVTLVALLQKDLLDHVGGHLEDDAAAIAIERLPAGPVR
ncbi:PP2C family protein-serine/threonine phosphatase [Actinoallomurus rhizosphaericola]|uniref:PP2C family protein-serine/threonine phosphatase n=1 Tax=Actinoallomurus rhizosphaericola TaxID=2952536 RepID=UPI002091D156|nr:PP2C family protein-serine/threonine phosphatase [Actinoallomurus rhizosphaericola]MCO5994103.1 serine/threonine-protein phosphatase [Actinoallomurus rhizosphaericola]